MSDSGPTLTTTASPTYAGVWVVTTVSTISFFLRIFSRAVVTGDLGWEDLVMAIGWFTTLSGCIVWTVSIHYGVLASSSSEALAEYQPLAVELALIASAFAIVSLMIPKISVSLVLSRLLNPGRWMKWVIILPSVLALVMGVIAVIIQFVQCDPIPGQWNPAKYNPVCWNSAIQMDYSYFVGAWSAFLDFAYAAYPASVIFQLNLATQRKIEISILMGLGIVSGSVAIYKTSQFHLLMAHRNVAAETLYVMSQLTMWTIIETNLTIIAACIPLTSAVFRIVKKRTQDRLRKMGFDIKTSTNTGYRPPNLGYREFSRGNDKFSSNLSGSGNADSSHDETQIYIHHEVQVHQSSLGGLESDTIPLSKLRDLP